jgi:hypothetical protein
MSRLDKALAELEARRAREESERLKKRKLACDFVRQFYEEDVSPSQRLKAHGVEAWFSGDRLVLQRPVEGDFQEPLFVVVGEHGEIDAGGKSLGPLQAGEETAKTNALIAEIIAHFNL